MTTCWLSSLFFINSTPFSMCFRGDFDSMICTYNMCRDHHHHHHYHHCLRLLYCIYFHIHTRLTTYFCLHLYTSCTCGVLYKHTYVRIHCLHCMICMQVFAFRGANVSSSKAYVRESSTPETLQGIDHPQTVNYEWNMGIVFVGVPLYWYSLFIVSVFSVFSVISQRPLCWMVCVYP